MPGQPPFPTEAELEILTILWPRDWATVHDVFAELSKRRDIGYTAVLKLLQIMYAKGLVRRDESRRKHLYHAVQPPDATRQQVVARLIERVFNNSPFELIRIALASRPPTTEELHRLRTLIEQPANSPSPSPAGPAR